MMLKLRKLLLTQPSRAQRLEGEVEELNHVIEYQRGVIDETLTFMGVLSTELPNGKPAVNIQTKTLEGGEDEVLAETIRHAAWSLQSSIYGGSPPPPIFVEGSVH